jgi:hypothetical protein
LEVISLADERDFNSMQEDAIRRVQEMQRKSKSYVGNQPPVSPPSVPPPQPPSAPREDGKSRELFSLGGIKIDEEKALIALMIYILYKNKADMKLLLGLGYLLL